MGWQYEGGGLTTVVMAQGRWNLAPPQAGRTPTSGRGCSTSKIQPQQSFKMYAEPSFMERFCKHMAWPSLMRVAIESAALVYSEGKQASETIEIKCLFYPVAFRCRCCVFSLGWSSGPRQLVDWAFPWPGRGGSTEAWPRDDGVGESSTRSG